jgi:hypothetical protein
MRIKKRGFKRLTEGEYDKLKALLEFDVSNTKLATITGRSDTLIGLVRRFATYEGYKAHTTAALARSRGQARIPEVRIAAPEPKEPVQSNELIIIEKLNKIEAMLKGMTQEQVKAKPKQRGLFF